MKIQSSLVHAFASFLLLGTLVGTCYGDLKTNFYTDSCAFAEEVARNITTTRVLANPILAAKLLRLHFHDCFVRGCDASILLESNATNQAEKDAFPNLSLGGFDVITEIKAQLESRCPRTVSCADIVTLAARDAVASLNPSAWWKVKMGRRDGVESLASDAFTDLPSPFSNFTTLRNVFESKGLNVIDLVALSGAHTIGITRCAALMQRLYNFSGKGDTDPSLDPAYAAILKQKCPSSGNPGTELDMDPGSAQSFDTDYFRTVSANKGIFVSDAALLASKASRAVVGRMRKESAFFAHFGKAMRKMGSTQVLTGTRGQIRKNCSLVN